MMADKDDTLIEFPCDFPIKVMGETREDFADVIIALVQEHSPEFHAGKTELRASSGGRYISLTCMVYVTSKSQLDELYRALTAHPMVRVVL